MIKSLIKISLPCVLLIFGANVGIAQEQTPPKKGKGERVEKEARGERGERFKELREAVKRGDITREEARKIIEAKRKQRGRRGELGERGKLKQRDGETKQRTKRQRREGSNCENCGAQKRPR